MSAKLILIASVVLVGSLCSQTTSPFVEDWKLNTKRSKPKTRERLLRISAIPGGFDFASLPCVVDGEERTFTLPDAKHSSHTVSCKLINERTLKLTVNHDNGKVFTTQLVTISADGKTLEQVWSEKSEDGSPINQYDRVEVYEKQ